MIPDILNAVPRESLIQLMNAFDEGKTLIVEYEPGKFVGVNVTITDDMVIDAANKWWCCGSYKKGGDNGDK